MAFRALTAIGTFSLLTVTTLATASAAMAVTVNQGDRFYTMTEGNTDPTMACTVGYVDTTEAYTAGHCGNNGDNAYLLETNDHIGTFHTDYNQYGDRDFATIEYAPGVEKGTNGYSGDNIADPSAVNVGDEVHSYGGKTKQVYDGQVAGAIGNEIIATPEAGGQHGDSGGPVWNDDGFLGVYSTYWEDAAGQRVSTGWTPKDEITGKDVYHETVQRSIDERTGQPINIVRDTPVTPPVDEGTEDGTEGAVDTSSDGSSSEVPDTGTDNGTEAPVDGTDESTGPDTEAPVDGTDESEAPVDGTDESEAPVDGTDESEAPVDGTEDTNEGDNGTDESEAPVDGTEESEAPVDGTEDTNEGDNGTDESETPVDGTDESEAPNTDTEGTSDEGTEAPATDTDEAQLPEVPEGGKDAIVNDNGVLIDPNVVNGMERDIARSTGLGGTGQRDVTEGNGAAEPQSEAVEAPAAPTEEAPVATTEDAQAPVVGRDVLANTGTPAENAALAGMVLLAVGGALSAAARRRKQ